MTLKDAYIQIAREFDFTPQQVEYRLTHIQQGAALKIKQKMAKRLMEIESMKSSKDKNQPST